MPTLKTDACSWAGIVPTIKPGEKVGAGNRLPKEHISLLRTAGQGKSVDLLEHGIRCLNACRNRKFLFASTAMPIFLAVTNTTYAQNPLVEPVLSNNVGAEEACRGVRRVAAVSGP